MPHLSCRATRRPRCWRHLRASFGCPSPVSLSTPTSPSGRPFCFGPSCSCPRLRSQPQEMSIHARGQRLLLAPRPKAEEVRAVCRLTQRHRHNLLPAGLRVLRIPLLRSAIVRWRRRRQQQQRLMLWKHSAPRTAVRRERRAERVRGNRAEARYVGPGGAIDVTMRFSPLVPFPPSLPSRASFSRFCDRLSMISSSASNRAFSSAFEPTRTSSTSKSSVLFAGTCATPNTCHQCIR